MDLKMKDRTFLRRGRVFRTSGWIEAMSAWWAIRRTARQIGRLDDHLRRDIGLSPLPPEQNHPERVMLIAMTAWR